jgi:murein DD-endopeptidase MepM/ murein hydrolase activator NlpD
MKAGLKSSWERLFPERHIILRGRRRVWQLRLTRGTQLVVLAGCGGAMATFAYGASGYAVSSRLIAAKAAEVVQAQLSNADLGELNHQLQDRLDAVQGKLGMAVAQAGAVRGDLYTAEMRLRAAEAARDLAMRQRDDAEARVTATAESLAARTAQIDLLGRTLESLRTELRQSDAQRSATVARLHQLDGELQTSQAAAVQAKATAEAYAARGQLALAEREKTATDRDGLKARVAELEARLEQLGPAAPRDAAPVAAALPDKGPVAAALPDQAHQGWGEVERVLSAAGVDIDRFMARFGAVRSGQGGPFVALDPGKRKPARPGEIEGGALQNMLSSLPLAAPLQQYQVESRFGPRSDPFNGQRSFHSGVDLSAPFRAPVYSTAPGMVVYAGQRGDYGKVVEIDHGSGIVTRYAHLHRTNVVVGQRVGAHAQIGQLGSTGRSSGPHVHYEILVNGTPYDPEQFLKLGKGVALAVAK